MMWRFDTAIGRFYGESERFYYNKATEVPIISYELVLAYNLPFKSDEAMVMSMGFENMKFHARNFCLAHISLPGCTEARRIPLMVSDAMDLRTILIPVTMANEDMMREYLVGHLLEPSDEFPKASDIIRYQSFSYSSVVDDDLPVMSPLTEEGISDFDNSDDEVLVIIYEYNQEFLDQVALLTTLSDDSTSSDIASTSDLPYTSPLTVSGTDDSEDDTPEEMYKCNQ